MCSTGTRWVNCSYRSGMRTMCVFIARQSIKSVGQVPETIVIKEWLKQLEE